MTLNLNPLIAAGVVASTAATDAVYVMFNAAVTARRPSRAASWSALWYMLSAFAVISYTGNSIYVIFAQQAHSSAPISRCDGWIDQSEDHTRRPPPLEILQYDLTE